MCQCPTKIDRSCVGGEEFDWRKYELQSLAGWAKDAVKLVSEKVKSNKIIGRTPCNHDSVMVKVQNEVKLATRREEITEWSVLLKLAC